MWVRTRYEFDAFNNSHLVEILQLDIYKFDVTH